MIRTAPPMTIAALEMGRDICRADDASIADKQVKLEPVPKSEWIKVRLRSEVDGVGIETEFTLPMHQGGSEVHKAIVLLSRLVERANNELNEMRKEKP